MKKRFVLVALVCLMCLTLFAACDLGERDQDSDVKIPQEEEETTYTVSEIYDQNADSLRFDARQEATDIVNALATEVWGVDASVSAVCVAGDGIAGVVGVNGGMLSSFIFEADEILSEFYNAAADVKTKTIAITGFSPDDEILASQQAEVLQLLQAAQKAMEVKLSLSEDVQPQVINTYDTVVDLGDGKFLGGIFASGAWTGAFVWGVDEEGLTREEIMFLASPDQPIEQFIEWYLQGVYTSITSPTRVSLDDPYEYDPVEPNPPEVVVGFEEIFNRIFGEDYDVPTCESVLENILSTAIPNGKNLKLICADISSDNLKFYTEGVNNLGRTVFSEVEYLGNNGETISAYLNILKEIGEAGSFMGYAQEMCGFSGDVEEGSDEYTAVVNFLNNLQGSLERGEGVITSLISKNFGSTGLVSQTREKLPAPANQFGEAILEDQGINGNIITTYVGDLGPPIFDLGHVFDSGYQSNGHIAVVYEQNGSVVIGKYSFSVPVYNNERGDSEALYSHLLKEGEYSVGLESQIEIDKETVVLGTSYMTTKSTLA